MIYLSSSVVEMLFPVVVVLLGIDKCIHHMTELIRLFNVIIIRRSGNGNTALRLRKLLEKDIKLKWHIVSLSDYWREGLIPRGLRISKFPSTYTEDATFKSKWESILNKCSSDLMLLLIQEGKKERERIQSLITNIESSGATTSEHQVPWQDSIRAEVLKLETTIKDLKVRKFKRDTEDYQRGQVYRWNQPRSFRSHRHTHHQTDRQSRPRLPRVSFNLTSSEDEGRSRGSDSDHFLEEDWPELRPNRSTLRKRAEAAGGEEQTRLQPLRPQLKKKYPR